MCSVSLSSLSLTTILPLALLLFVFVIASSITLEGTTTTTATAGGGGGGAVVFVTAFQTNFVSTTTFSQKLTNNKIGRFQNNNNNNNNNTQYRKNQNALSLLKAADLLQQEEIVSTAFESFAFPKFNFFEGAAKILQTKKDNNGERKKLEAALLEELVGTGFGKTASLEKQRRVLRLVQKLESTYPAPPLQNLIDETPDLLDGTWYLQYTSPSSVPVIDDDEGEEEESSSSSSVAAAAAASWTIRNAEENITTKPFLQNKGSVSAGGINVELNNSRKPAKQIFDLSKSTLINEVVFFDDDDEDSSSGDGKKKKKNNSLIKTVKVGGSFRLSERNDRRAVVAFSVCNIELSNFPWFKFLPKKLDLSFLFDIIGLIKGTNENGWLETTYVSSDDEGGGIRIGRGNKGSMFVLTRDEEA